METTLEYVRNQITKLKDDLQHYTMVEKDSALASQIRYDLEQFETIEKGLQVLEILKNKAKCVTLDLTNTYGLIFYDTTTHEENILIQRWLEK